MGDLSPTMIVAAAAVGVAGWLMILLRFRTVLVVLGAMIFAASIAPPKDSGGTWLLPLQLMRAEIYLGGGIMILVGSLVHAGGLSLRRTSGLIWLLLALVIYQGMILILHGDTVEGVRTLAGALLTTFPLMLVVPMLLRNQLDWHQLVRVFLWVDVAWVGAAVVQLAIDPSRLGVGWHNRFVGVGGNPQLTGEFLGVLSVVTLWVAWHDPNRRFRLLGFALFAINMVMLLATGSRTGIGIFSVGAAAITYRRWGKFALSLPLGLIAIWGLYELLSASGISFGLDRIMSTEDTRSDAWASMLEDAMASPLIGWQSGEVERNENSYLWAFARFGIGALALLLMLMFASIAHSIKLLNTSRYFPAWRPIIDLCVGFFAMFFAGAVFDGYILLRATLMVIAMIVFASMSGRIMQAYVAGEELLDDAEGLDEYVYDDEHEVGEELALDEYGTGAAGWDESPSGAY